MRPGFGAPPLIEIFGICCGVFLVFKSFGDRAVISEVEDQSTLDETEGSNFGLA